MTQLPAERIPREIQLHSKSRLLVITFPDDRRFSLPCEYLRVFSRAKEVRTLETPVTGKESVNITSIEPQGQYAVRLVFDDGHDTGIYSWDTLYELGENQDRNWQDYLTRLQQLGIGRTTEPGVAAESGVRRINLLYFTYLVQQMRKEFEALALPADVGDVQSLLDWLRRRSPEQAHLLAEGSIQVTVNKQFAEPITHIDDGDEVALIPTSPIAPVAKD